MPIALWPTVRKFLPVLLVGLGCYAGAKIGTMLRFPPGGAAILFPPYAVLAAALLLTPRRTWWMYLLAATAGNFLPHLLSGRPLSFVLLADVANCSRALVAAAGVRHFVQTRDRLDSLRSMTIFLLFAGLLAPMVGATLGAGVVRHPRPRPILVRLA